MATDRTTAFRLRSKSAIRTVWCTDSRIPSARRWETAKPAETKTAIFRIPAIALPRAGATSSTRPTARSFHFVYDLPFGKGLRGAPGHLIKGWQVNGILSLRSGFPFTVTQSADLNTGGTPIRPDRIASGSLGDNASRQLWFDPTAFRRVSCNIPSRPDLCHYGNSGKAIFNTPGQRNLDFSALQEFSSRGKTRGCSFAASFSISPTLPISARRTASAFRTLTRLCRTGRETARSEVCEPPCVSFSSLEIVVLNFSPTCDAGAQKKTIQKYRFSLKTFSDVRPSKQNEPGLLCVRYLFSGLLLYFAAFSA